MSKQLDTNVAENIEHWATGPELPFAGQPMGAGDDDDSQDHSGKDSDDEGHLGLALADPELEEPRLFKVVLLNDDYTPMDFVVEVLMKFFSLDHDRATQIMLHVHTRGKGVCGVFSYQVAETKAVLVNDYSRENQHPLQCSVESA